MSDQRIRVAELREWAERDDTGWKPYVLALLEVREAAHELIERELLGGLGKWHHYQQSARLHDKLQRFDFVALSSLPDGQKDTNGR